MTASGTAGHADELGSYFPLQELGAIVVKSLSVDPWPGNPAPRVHQTPSGMLNSVGLQGPGIAAWLADDLPALVASRARVVVSIWGQRVDDFARAAKQLNEAMAVVAEFGMAAAAEVGEAVAAEAGRAVPAEVGEAVAAEAGEAVAAEAGRAVPIIALEVNVSCPNVEDRRKMFAHSPTATAEVLERGERCVHTATVGQVEPQCGRSGRDRRRRTRFRGRRNHPGEHGAGYGHRCRTQPSRPRRRRRRSFGSRHPSSGSPGRVRLSGRLPGRRHRGSRGNHERGGRCRAAHGRG